MLAGVGIRDIIAHRNATAVSGPESFRYIVLIALAGLQILPISNINPLRWPKGGSCTLQYAFKAEARHCLEDFNSYLELVDRNTCQGALGAFVWTHRD
jgi:hypothetical protein